MSSRARSPSKPKQSGSIERKAHIVAAASKLIRRHGYANVSMKDIAELVGVSAPALYRHFTGKQQLLGAAISAGLGIAEGAVHGVRADGLDAIVGALSQAAVAETSLWVLLHREARHLDASERNRLAGRFSALIDIVSDAIQEARPGVEGGRAHIEAQAVLAALSAPSQYRQTLTAKTLASTLAMAALRIPGCTDSPSQSPRTVRWRLPFDPTLHRREAILQAAATLFAEHGYDAVTLSDIGAAADIAGPSIYNHFDGKADVLAGVLWRSVDWIESDMTWAVAEFDQPADALRAVYDAYTAIAIDHPELFRVFTVEGVHLPDLERDRIGRAHRHFVERWIALLQSANPAHTSGTARADISASLCVINDLSHRVPLRDGPVGTHMLTSMAVAVAGL